MDRRGEKLSIKMIVAILVILAVIVWIVSNVIGALTMGPFILDKSLGYIQSSVQPPANYKQNFGVWTIVQNKDTGAYESVLAVPQAGYQGIQLAAVSTEGYDVDLDAFKEALTHIKTSNGEMLKHYFDALTTYNETNSNSSLTFDAEDLTIALLANVNSEGRPLMWEDSESKRNKAGGTTKIDGVDYMYLLVDGAKVVYANKVDGTWYTTTKEQFENLYSYRNDSKLEDAHIGFGSVQWSGGRCINYIEYLWENGVKDMPAGTLDTEKVKELETAYLFKDLDSYVRNYFPSSMNKSDCKMGQIAAFITAVYECPYNSYAFQRSKYESGNTVYDTMYMRDKTTGEVTPYKVSNNQRNIFYAGDSWDVINKEYYWLTSDGTKETVSEPYRMKKAQLLWEELSSEVD